MTINGSSLQIGRFEGDQEGSVRIGAGMRPDWGYLGDLDPEKLKKLTNDEISKRVSKAYSVEIPTGYIEIHGGDPTTRLRLSVEGTQAHLEMFDSGGFYTILGNTGLVTTQTGESRTTSAASLVMFDNNGSLIWRAP